MSDWALHGGVNSYNASPLNGNASTLSKEDDTVFHFQTVMNQVLVNSIGINVAYATHGTFSAGNPSTTQHTFTVDGPDFGPHVLSGSSSDQFVPLGNGEYDTVSSGTFADGSLSIYLSFVDRVRAASQSRSIAFILVDSQGNAYDYAEEDSSVFTGSWGNCLTTHDRTVDGWDRIRRTSHYSQTLAWAPSLAEVTALTSSVGLTRDFPSNPPSITAYANWLASGGMGTPPNAPYCTEKITFQCNANVVAGGLQLTYPTYTVDHGQHGFASQNNCKMDALRTGGNEITATYVYNFSVAANALVKQVAVATLAPTSKDIAMTGNLSINGLNAAGFTQYIDPIRTPMVQGHTGFWATVWWGAATFVTGAACTVGTIGTAIATGASTVATLGALTPVMVTACGAAGGTCAVATGAVCNSLW